MRSVQEFLEHFTDSPLGLPIIPSLKVQDVCYAFNFIALNLTPPIKTQASMYYLISLIEGNAH